jgi:hypothetical protein
MDVVDEEHNTNSRNHTRKVGNQNSNPYLSKKALASNTVILILYNSRYRIMLLNSIIERRLGAINT